MGSAAWNPLPAQSGGTVPATGKREIGLATGGSSARQRSCSVKVTDGGTATNVVLTVEQQINGIWESVLLGAVDLGEIAAAVTADQNGLQIPIALAGAGIQFGWFSPSGLYRVGLAGDTADAVGFVTLR